MIDPVEDEPDGHAYRRKLATDAAETRSSWSRVDDARRVLTNAILATGNYDSRDHAELLVAPEHRPIAEAIREVSHSDRNPAGEEFTAEAYADVIAQRMDVATWRAVREVVRQYGIGYAAFNARFMERLRTDDDVRVRFLDLVDTIVNEAAADPAVGVIMRDDRDAFRHYAKRWTRANDPTRPWHERPDLAELLSGNVRGDESYWGIGEGALSYVRELDLPRFVGLLKCFDIPHPIHAELIRSRVERDVGLLCDLLKAAPPTIEADGSWNGSLIAPLVLASAIALLRERRCAWYRSMRDRDQRQAPKNDLPDRTAYCSEPVEPITDALLFRSDGAVLGLRWATYLVGQVDRRIDQFGWKAIEERSGYGAEEAAVLTVLGRKVDPSLWLGVDPPDLPPGEQVHLEAARTLAFIAHDDRRLDDPLSFLERTPEEFATDKGLHHALGRLRPSASSPQRWAGELLGWRLLNAADPAARLERTWDAIVGVRAHAQRPIHPVASVPGRASGDDPHAHAHDWDRLPQAVFSIGLGALDWTARRDTSTPIPLNLWNSLYCFVWERWATDVRAFDKF